MSLNDALHGLDFLKSDKKDESYWEKIGKLFLTRPGLVHLNTGTQCPMLVPVYETIVQHERASQEDFLRYHKSVFTMHRKALLREKLAAFCGAKPHEVAFTSGVTEGISFGVFGQKMSPGDEIVYTNHDHWAVGNPAILRAYREGLGVRVVDLSAKQLHPCTDPGEIVQRVKESLTSRTRLLLFCHINYTDGLVMPVREICDLAREKGVITCVDGAQGPGMLNVDVRALGCDMYVGASYKWMLGPGGLGFLYIREELEPTLTPILYRGCIDGRSMLGPMNDEDQAYAACYPGAARFEIRGAISPPALEAFGVAMDVHSSIGKDAIEHRTQYLATFVSNKLSDIPGVEVFRPIPSNMRSALVAFRIRGVPTNIVTDRLYTDHGILTRHITLPQIDWDANRVSMHMFVAQGEAEKFICAVQAISAGRNLGVS